MSDWLREQANDEREAQEEAETAYREMLRFEAQNATLLSALKAMDAALTEAWGAPEGTAAEHFQDRDTMEAWKLVRSAIAQADGR